MSVIDAPVAGEERPRGQLRRELRLFEARAISVGIMAPTAAMALNGVAPAGLVGRAVPLAFLFAAIAIALVSYAFVRLTRYFNHAGSAYAQEPLAQAATSLQPVPVLRCRVAPARDRNHARVPRPGAQDRAESLSGRGHRCTARRPQGLARGRGTHGDRSYGDRCRE
jgi:hypothetical protein